MGEVAGWFLCGVMGIWVVYVFGGGLGRGSDRLDNLFPGGVTMRDEAALHQFHRRGAPALIDAR